MKIVLVGTINEFQIRQELEQELAQVKQCIIDLVNAKPFGEHSDQDLKDYLDLRQQEEQLKIDLL